MFQVFREKKWDRRKMVGDYLEISIHILLSLSKIGLKN